jgi:hypothetical protein
MSDQSYNLAEQFLKLMGNDISKPEEQRSSGAPGRVSSHLVSAIINSVQVKRPDLWDGTCLKSGRYPSASEADYALCGYAAREALKLNVSKDNLVEAVQLVFQQSKLYREKKWHTVKTQTIPKIVLSLMDETTNQLEYEKSKASSPSKHTADNLLSDLILLDSHVQEMQDAVFIVDNMIVRGHIVAFVAPANSGKTALLIHFSEQITQAGCNLFYINCDASPSDLKRHFEHAKNHNYKLIAPDAIPGKSPRDVLLEFREYLESGTDLSNVVIVLDTLKKFVDVIEKRAAKELYSLLRSLTVRGCTVVLLGHCNKHLDKDNRTIFEGTADLRNDLDELIYLDAQKDEAKSLLRITTRPDKVRADIKPRSFLIHLPDREVEELDQPIRIVPRSEEEILDLATEGVFLGKVSQKDLVEFIGQRVTSDVGEKRIKKTLATHALANNRITVRKAGRAKDLLFGLTAGEGALKRAEQEAIENLPF